MKDDHGYVQIGEITFSLNDVVTLIDSETYTINKPIIHKTAYSKNTPYKSSNITLPANLNIWTYGIAKLSIIVHTYSAYAALWVASLSHMSRH
jgi:hypothetical protein